MKQESFSESFKRVSDEVGNLVNIIKKEISVCIEKMKSLGEII